MIVTYCWYFFIYAFLGWCTEVVFAAVNKGVFVNRGFLNGPVCPIYGFGVSAVIALLTPIKDNLLVLFVGSVLVTSLLELVTGFVMEKLFRQKWWDYSEMPFNIGGYVCLAFSLVWGIVCVLVIKVVHPLIDGLVTLIPHTLAIVLLCIFFALFLADIVATICSVTHFNRALVQIDDIAAKLEVLSCAIGENVSAKAIQLRDKNEPKIAELKEKSEKLKEEFSKKHARLLNAFPNMSSSKYNATLDKIKQHHIEKKGA